MGAFLMLVLIVCGVFAVKNTKSRKITIKRPSKVRKPTSSPPSCRIAQPLITSWPSSYISPLPHRIVQSQTTNRPSNYISPPSQRVSKINEAKSMRFLETVSIPKGKSFMDICLSIIKKKGFWSISATRDGDAIIAFAYRDGGKRYKILCEKIDDSVSFKIAPYVCPPSQAKSKRISDMSGTEFEQYCMDWLRKKEFTNIEGTPGSGDQGVDITARKDGKKYAFQCKRYKGAVGNRAVQEVYSGKDCYECDVAVVLTNSTFTQKARELAEVHGVLLWTVT